MVIIGNKNIKEFVGVVVSNKMDKTIVVSSKSVKKNDLYNKRFVIAKKLYAHDENNTAQIGDTVKIRETRPMSKLKRWELVEVC